MQNNYKNQIVYQTNADYFASYTNLNKAKSNVVASLEQTKKGLIWFRLAETNTVFILSPNGKLQVKWNRVEEKKLLMKLIRHLLVAENNKKLKIIPLQQQAWIPYDAPKGFRVYWCDEVKEYSTKGQGGFWSYLDRRVERKRLDKEKKEERDDLEMRIARYRLRIGQRKREYFANHPQSENIPSDVIAEIEKQCREEFGLELDDPI